MSEFQVNPYPFTAFDMARAYSIPMSLIDGRPWVPTEAEADVGDGDE